MTAVKLADWDKFSSDLRAVTDAIEEDLYDRPNMMDQALFDALFTPVEKLFNSTIKPRLNGNISSVVKQDLEQAKTKAATQNYAGCLDNFRNIYETIPELAGRYESYDCGLRRRKTTHYVLTDNAALSDIFDLHAAGKTALFFDLDGTLVLADPGHNSGYHADKRMQFVLNRLNAQNESAMAVVTGRPELFMQEVFPEGAFFSATEHGVFVRNKVGADVQRSYKGTHDIEALKKHVSREMHRRGLDHKECFVEAEKAGSITVQFTEASCPKDAARVIHELLEQIMFSPRNGSCVDPLMLVDGNVEGNRVMDLVPQSADKGHTLQWFYKTYPHIFEGKTPVMFGDSGGDETAMAWAKKNGGYAIGVGKEAPQIADVRLSSVSMMRDLVTCLAERTENARNKANGCPSFMRL